MTTIATFTRDGGELNKELFEVIRFRIKVALSRYPWTVSFAQINLFSDYKNRLDVKKERNNLECFMHLILTQLFFSVVNLTDLIIIYLL